MQELRGTGVALITPFDTNKEIDEDGLRRVVRFQIENGIDYLVVLGTTGESATLAKEEKKRVIEIVRSENNGRLPMVLGIGGNNTRGIVQELQQTDLSDFVAVLSVSPSYNKPTQEGIYQHFAQVAKATSKPIILYNVPGRTASNMLPKTVIRLAQDFENIVAIKEAAGDIVQAMELISGAPDGFLVISGDDMIALPMTLAGGAGVISVIGEGFPKAFSDMIRHGLNRQVDEAYAIQYRIAPAIDMIFEEGNPAGIKAVFEKLGLCESHLRLPLVPVSSGLAQRISDFVDRF